MESIMPELAAALNTLLEGERASVEMEVALASGATEYTEREALTAMGTRDLEACAALREYLERQGAARELAHPRQARIHQVLSEVYATTSVSRLRHPPARDRRACRVVTGRR